MAYIVDIIHRITYETTGQEKVSAIEKQFQRNAEIIAKNVASLARLQNALNNTTDPAQQARLTQAINNRTQAIEQQNAAMRQTILTDTNLQSSLQREIGVLNELANRLNLLREARQRATSTTEIQQYNQQIAAIEARQRQLTAAPAARLSITRATPTANSNVLASPATAQSVNAVRSLQGEIGIINQLNKKLEELRAARQRAMSTQEIQNYNRQIEQIEREQNRLLGGRNSRLGGIGQSILQGFGIGSGMQILDTVVGGLKDMVAEASQFAAEIEGVKPAFDALNRPDLLSQLRVATKGTISDLELMKQAVQYNNLGLPLDRMATALQFARIRARETGQSVDYLVQSIVNGIGRQSVLILDNLGISAAKVREEVAKTGDFGEAAFKIIEEGIKGANDAMDTHQEKWMRYNATIQNTQAELGKFQNFYKDFWSGVLMDLVTAQGGENSHTQQVIKGYQAQIDAAREANSERFTQDRLYQVYFTKFLDQIGSLDLNGRQERLKQAEALFNQDLELQRQFYGASSTAFASFQRSFLASYERFRKQVAGTPINLQGITAQNITSASKTTLEESVSLLQGQLANTPSDDTKTINDINRRIAILQNRLKVYDPVDNAKIAADAKKREEEARRAIEERYRKEKEALDLADQKRRLDDEQLKGVYKIRDAFNELLIDETERGDRSKEYIDYLQQEQKGREKIVSLIERERKVTFDIKKLLDEISLDQRYGKDENIPAMQLRLRNLNSDAIETEANLQVTIKEISMKPLDTYQVNDIQQRADELVKKALEGSVAQAGRARDSVNKPAIENMNIFGGDMQRDIKEAIQLYEALSNTAVQSYNSIADAKQQQIARELEYQQYAISQAQILAERGNTEVLKQEEERQRELIKRQREAARQQQIINQALVLSNALVAVARAAAEGGGYGSIATVAATIAALGAGYAFVQSFSRDSAQGFKDGVIDLKGAGTTKSDSIPARLSRGESVMTAEATAMYKPILEKMQALEYNPFQVIYPKQPETAQGYGMASSKEVGKLNKKLDGVIGAIRDYMPVKVNTRIDQNGVANLVERSVKNQRQRWS